MFFNMLKSDLRHKKSLNLILFIFITIASLLVFVSTVQIYVLTGGEKAGSNYCHSSDIISVFEKKSTTGREENYDIEQYIAGSADVNEYYVSDMIIFQDYQFTIGEKEISSDFYNLLCPQPREADLVYDINNKPFYVENSTIAVCRKFADLNRLKVGDKVRIITDKCNIYEFTVSHIFKEQLMSDYIRFIISDGDYEQISEEFYSQTKFYHIFTDAKEPMSVADDIIEESNCTEWNVDTLIFGINTTFDNEHIISFIISVFLSMISAAVIVIILVTLRFTIISTLKDEEKEIGMLRALGIDSLRFRWLFAAKYIVFAVIGGIIGAILGFPASKSVLDKFSADIVFPESEKLIITGSLAVVLLSVVIIIFCMLFVHRMKRISAIDALHGENHGERYGKSAVFFLHSTNRMKVPFYLALSDIFGHLRHYLFLIVSYSLGIAIILSSFHVRNSIVCADFIRYCEIGYYDFDFDYSFDPVINKLSGSGSFIKGVEYLEKELNEKDIPVSFECESFCYSQLIGQQRKNCILYYGGMDLSNFCIHGNGKLPVLKNEVMVSYNSARRIGIETGDIISVEIPEGIDGNLVRHDFVVTALFDFLDMDTAYVITGEEYKNDYREYYNLTNFRINAPEKKKPYYIEKMNQILGEGAILDPQQAAEDYLGNIANVFHMLVRFMTVTVSGILILITMLYMNIFHSDDKHSIGLLRCLGYSRKNIRIWQMSKITILTVISTGAAQLIACTFGSALISKLFEILSMTGFRFVIEPVDTFVKVPVISASAILITAYIKIRSEKDISIHEISEE